VSSAATRRRTSSRTRIPPSACLYVGDDLRDVQAARAAGMGVIAAAWGYLGEDGDPHGWGADTVIAHPLDTLKAL
jgi:N-acetyl-D-muramate 6-phosphate phosphatase